MEINLDQNMLDSVSDKIRNRLKSPSYGIESKLEGYAEATQDTTLAESRKLITNSFSVLELLANQLSRTNGSDPEPSNVYSAYITSEYAMYLLNGASQSPNAIATNPYKFNQIDFSQTHPLPREDMLEALSGSIGRISKLSLLNQTGLFFSWLNEETKIKKEKFEKHYKDLHVKIGEDFEIRGAGKPFFQVKKEKNGLNWEDFGGYEEIVNHFKGLVSVVEKYDYVMSLGTVNKKEILPKGTLLYGPPGTGKTTLARIFCNELDVPFTYMGATDIADRHQFGSPLLLEEKFQLAARAITEGGYKASVLFMDEASSYLGKRQVDRKDDARVVTTFNEYMSGSKETDGVLAILATNNVEHMDPAVLRRVKENSFYMGYPDIETARKIFNVHLRNRRSNLNKGQINSLLATYGTDNDGKSRLTGADIEMIVRNTYRNKMIGHLNGQEDYIPSMEDFAETMINYQKQ